MVAHKDIIEQFWDNQISILDKDNNVVEKWSSALIEIYEVITHYNCFGGFYEYKNLVQQSTEENINLSIIADSLLKETIDDTTYIYIIRDFETAESDTQLFFRYGSKEKNYGFREIDSLEYDFLFNTCWKVSEVFNGDEKQYFDSCFAILNICFDDGFYVDISYNGSNHCHQRLSDPEIEEVSLLGGFERINSVDHFLSSTKATFKIHGEDVVLKFDNGEIKKYRIKYDAPHLAVSAGNTKYILERRF